MKRQERHVTQGLVCLLMILMGTSTLNADDRNAPFILAYDRVVTGERARLESVFYTFQPGLTRVQNNDVIFYIDYAHLNLYRYEEAREICVRYPLRDPAVPMQTLEPGNTLVERKLLEIGKVEVVKGGEREDIQGYSCQQYAVIFGPDIQRLRTVVTPAVEQYGQLFHPLMAKVWVTGTLEGMDDLVSLAHAYTDVYRANPLLRQLDPLGLLLQLQGVVVMKQHDHTQDTLKAAGRSRGAGDALSLPDACRSLQ